MKLIVLIALVALSACGKAPEASNMTAASVVTVSLPNEPPAPWKSPGAALIEQNCLACHSPEMIATQPPLNAEKWQATIDKMRTVYKAQIDKAGDPALVAALVAAQKQP